jgi:hypothetical protein
MGILLYMFCRHPELFVWFCWVPMKGKVFVSENMLTCIHVTVAKSFSCLVMELQGGSNMTGTECSLFTHKSVPVIFESPCTFRGLLSLSILIVTFRYSINELIYSFYGIAFKLPRSHHAGVSIYRLSLYSED